MSYQFHELNESLNPKKTFYIALQHAATILSASYDFHELNESLNPKKAYYIENDAEAGDYTIYISQAHSESSIYYKLKSVMCISQTQYVIYMSQTQWAIYIFS